MKDGRESSDLQASTTASRLALLSTPDASTRSSERMTPKSPACMTAQQRVIGKPRAQFS